MDGFRKDPADDLDEGYWTEERILTAAKRIIKKLRIEGELQ